MSKRQVHTKGASKGKATNPQVYAFSKGSVNGYVVDYKAHITNCTHPTPHRDGIVRFLKAAVNGK